MSEEAKARRTFHKQMVDETREFYRSMGELDPQKQKVKVSERLRRRRRRKS